MTLRALLKLPNTGGSRQFDIAVVFVLLAVFSVPVLGASANDILLFTGTVFLIISPERHQIIQVLRSNTTALLGVLLFCWIALSVLWADAEWSASLKILSKYRNFVWIAILMAIFREEPIKNYALWVIFAGLLLALMYSFGGAAGLYDTPRQLSAHGRIFNGISTPFLAYMNLWFAARRTKFMPLYIVLYMLCFIQVFLVEDARLGYLTFVALTFVFFVQRMKVKGIILAAIGLTLISSIVLFFPEHFPARLAGLTDLIVSDYHNLQHLQKADNRAEFYLLSTYIFAENWLLGVGVGGFASAYADQLAVQVSFWPPTADPHNEFLMIATQTGVIGLVIFLVFLASIPYTARNAKDAVQRQMVWGLLALIILACLFNSSFLAHYDGFFFMVLIAILLANGDSIFSETRKTREADMQRLEVSTPEQNSLTRRSKNAPLRRSKSTSPGLMAVCP